ncbi:MAG: RagB/SusD family nutrient uptake outer membrane protein [Bacteroidales bacterium]|nr:RagB/SusD family nutrient uptake outer membrane protein [Bacteroidales bacterium]
MKSYIKFLTAVGTGCLLFASCDNDEFLETTKYDILEPSVQFANDDYALMNLNGIYTFNGISDFDASWGYKPNMFTGTHPTMDTQCTGWDVKFLDQTWDASVGELGEGWSHAYAAISRANLFLTGLEDAANNPDANVSDACKKTCEGEARALRGYFYTWLAQTFGRVPMLYTGEDYNNTPVKAKAETYEEMWDFIIDDFKAAADLLDWQPYNGNYGRCTKGMALAYLADAYMWKAYRCPEVADENYKLAKAALKSILESGTYSLATNFSTNWDPAGFWNSECIWAEVCDEGDNWSSWGGKYLDTQNSLMIKWFAACPENGGWGAQYLSWEWYACYESGDKRRDASCVTGAVPEADLAKYGIEKSASVWGYNPWLQDSLGTKNDAGIVVNPYKNAEGEWVGTKTRQFHFTNGEYAPAIWTSKFWRSAYADGNSWGVAMWEPVIIYGKRLANVMLDYAECCFRTGDENTGWQMLDDLRNRAWGNLEVGQDYSKYYGHYNEMYKAVGNGKTMTAYPLPVNTAVVTVPDAKTYYTALQATPNRVGYKHTSEVWKVAVNEERRKEFSSEWSLCPDMVKSGYMEDHINYNYPKDNTEGDALRDYPWSHRVYDYDARKMDMPIPSIELMKNSALIQNDAYLGKSE